MKKQCLILILLGCALILLCSCSLGGDRMGIFDDSDTKADEVMDQVFETIKNKDKDALKSMFSKQALSDADDFVQNIDSFFSYIQGEVKSWERTGTHGGHDVKNADGNRRKDIQSIYILNTDEQKYEIAIYEFTIDTVNPDNVGIYSICIININEKEDPEISYWGSGKAGINIK